VAKQGLAELTPDLLILKVSILEEQFKKLEKLISTKLFQLDSQLQTQIGPIATNNQSDGGMGAP
jgi:tetrahydromethanopterin S-methyltransferase subunit B